MRAVSGNSRSGSCFKLDKETWRRKKQWYRDMVGHLFQNYDTIYVRFFPRILAIIPATRCTCVFLPRILAFFPTLWGFYFQVYDHFLTNAHIYARKKSPYICVTESRRIRGTESYRQQKNPLMYDGTEE